MLVLCTKKCCPVWHTSGLIHSGGHEIGGDTAKDPGQKSQVSFTQIPPRRKNLIRFVFRLLLSRGLGPWDFFGEGCLAGQPTRIGTATSIAPTTALIIEKSEMVRSPFGT